MNLKDAKAMFLLEHCAERCDGYQKDDACKNCEINAAISALEKQIPKKPISITISGISRYKSGVCKCGTAIVMTYKYCPSCGQAINWSDGELKNTLRTR